MKCEAQPGGLTTNPKRQRVCSECPRPCHCVTAVKELEAKAKAASLMWLTLFFFVIAVLDSDVISQRAFSYNLFSKYVPFASQILTDCLMTRILQAMATMMQRKTPPHGTIDEDDAVQRDESERFARCQGFVDKSTICHMPARIYAPPLFPDNPHVLMHSGGPQ